MPAVIRAIEPLDDYGNAAGGDVGKSHIAISEPGGRIREAQADVASHLVAAGHGYLCSSDYRDVVETLKAWGVLRGGFTVQ
jgi:hypothetical protein